MSIYLNRGKGKDKNFIYSIACSSGTDALVLALKSLEIGMGDEVIVPGFSFFATAECVSLVGAKPVFCDIRADDYNINEDLIKDLISSKTKAIIAVGLFGQSSNIYQIIDIARENGLAVIEDTAQNFGSEIDGIKSCKQAKISCTSFFPAKPLGAYGDGGAVFTSDAYLAEKMRSLLNHGQGKHYQHHYIGYNARLDTIQAAVLRVKLKYFEKEIELRQKVAERYFQLLSNEIKKPVIAKNKKSVFAQFSLYHPTKRDDLVEFLKQQGIPIAIHYPLAIYQQPVYRDIYRELVLENCEKTAKGIFSLPMYPYLTKREQDRVIEAVNRFF